MELTIGLTQALVGLPISLQSSPGHLLHLLLPIVLSAFILFPYTALAVPPFSDADMQNYLRYDRAGLARLNAPYVFLYTFPHTKIAYKA